MKFSTKSLLPLLQLGAAAAANHGHEAVFRPRGRDLAARTGNNTHYVCWPHGSVSGEFIDWTTFKANGANLGGWLAKEKTHDPLWWATLGDVASEAVDEWNLCEALGSSCGEVLEARYADFLNTTTIDQLASVGVNVLRIPTTYAAWVEVPGSSLYHGNQRDHLREIALYAIETYKMHVIIGLHSLPGGVNSLDIGEALGHGDWFFDQDNLDYSLDAVSAILDFIVDSGHVNAFTISPINEASDTSLAGFGTAAGLTEEGADWILGYLDGVFDLVEAVDPRIPVMMQDCFKGVQYWTPLFDASRNLVVSPHVYYFAADGTYSQWVDPAICGQAAYLAEDLKFPVFVGEWALQVKWNNTFAERKSLFDTQRYAWAEYLSGGTFWTAVSYAQAEVDGEGIQRDYWSYIDLINAGVITKAVDKSYC